MARGQVWTDKELELLDQMIEQGLNPQQIYDGGKLPGRTFHSIVRQFYGNLIAPQPKVDVSAVEPAADALQIEQVVKLFSTAFQQVCSLQQLDKLVLERFRLIFQAAKDYGPLLAGYERWDKIEKQIDELAAKVAQIQAAKGVSKASGDLPGN